MLPERIPYARRQAQKVLSDTCDVLATGSTINEYGEATADAPTVDRTYPCLLFFRSGSESEKGASVVPVGSWGMLLPVDAVIGGHERVRITGRNGANRGLWDAVIADTGATDALLLTVSLEKVG